MMSLMQTQHLSLYNSDQVVINLPAVVGCLNWIALRSRPDIAWATSRAASLITHDPDLCFIRVKHICQYLQHTLSYALRYVPIPPTSKQKLWVLGDASFAPTGEKSQQGIVVYHGITSNQRQGGNLVQWRSSRQDLVAKSTCEAELIAASEALQQGENISIVISEMTNASCEIEVSSDNAAALHMVRNGSETAWRTRHISVKALWLHQMSRRGIRFTYQSTSDMAADSLTKGMGVAFPRSRMIYVSSTIEPPTHALSRERQVFKLFQCIYIYMFASCGTTFRLSMSILFLCTYEFIESNRLTRCLGDSNPCSMS